MCIFFLLTLLSSLPIIYVLILLIFCEVVLSFVQEFVLFYFLWALL